MPKDRTKYNLYRIRKLSEKPLCKRRLVLAVVQDYVANNPNVTYEQLKRDVFPDYLQQTLNSDVGVIKLKSEVTERRKNRFLMDSPIKLNDGREIVVSSEWGICEKGNINDFIQNAEKLGYVIEAIKS